MDIERKLYDAAVDLIKTRYHTGWGGAAAMYTKGGRILTSIAPEVLGDATNLCIERFAEWSFWVEVKKEQHLG